MRNYHNKEKANNIFFLFITNCSGKQNIIIISLFYLLLLLLLNYSTDFIIALIQGYYMEKWRPWSRGTYMLLHFLFNIRDLWNEFRMGFKLLRLSVQSNTSNMFVVKYRLISISLITILDQLATPSYVSNNSFSFHKCLLTATSRCFINRRKKVTH